MRTHSYSQEIRQTLILAIPIILGQVGQMILPVVDAVMIGRVSTTLLAAAAFGGAIMNIFVIIGYGLCVAVHVVVASALGAGRKDECVPLLQQGIWIALTYAALTATSIHVGIRFLDYCGQEYAVAQAAKPYVLYLAWSTIPVLVFQCFKNYAESMRHPWTPLCVLGGGILLNAFLNWLLIFGHWGFPAMELRGAGLATLLARIGIMLFLAIWLISSTKIPLLWSWKQFSKWKKKHLRSLLGIGLSSAFQILFEVGLFTAAAVMMGWVSAITLAAHQIVCLVCTFAFMVPLGISLATGIRVGDAYGRKDYTSIRQIVVGNSLFSACFMGTYGLLLLVLRYQIPHVFVKDPAVTALATQLLLAAVAMAVFDGVQVTVLGALRGMYDIKIPVLISLVSYWMISLPVAYALAFTMGWGGIGVWLGIVTGVMTAFVLLLWRFAYLHRSRSSSSYTQTDRLD